MKYASLHMRGGRAVHGVITRLERIAATADQAHYAVTLESRLALLSLSRRCAVFQNCSVPEVVEQVLRSHGLEGADFAFCLTRRYPPRELITQWQETDLQFIQRILSETGIWWRTGMDDARGLDVFTFADGPLHYRFGVRLPWGERFGFRPVEIPRPVMAGTLPARIESREKHDPYAHLDEHGRYLRISREQIEYGTPGVYVRNVKMTANAARDPLPFPSVAGGGICLSCLMKASVSGNAFVIRGER